MTVPQESPYLPDCSRYPEKVNCPASRADCKNGNEACPILWHGHSSGAQMSILNGGCYGDEINAAANGVVVFADWHSGYGLKVIIDHGDGLSTLYAHCSKLLVSVGDTVLKGQSVALIGATGRVTGPHLHFEVLKNGAPVNPNNYIDWSTYKGSI